VEINLKRDVSGLTKGEKQDLLNKEIPELRGLLEDYQVG
jgi:hypothetical protein